MKKILVAEDDAASRALILEILSLMGYEVTAAADGGEAVRMIEETAPDLVLLDIQMPVLDGFAVLRWLRQHPRFARLPVLALTAFAMREDRNKFLSAGFNAHIPKPINTGLLSAQIEALLGEKTQV